MSEEEEVFDRQTRLWGADAQKRIRTSRVLIRGQLQGLASELCKNLVLAGVNISIYDDSPVKEEDLYTNIFLRNENIGKPRAESMLPGLKEMNPFANVDLASDVEKIDQLNIVISIGEDFETMKNIGKVCREKCVPIIAARSAGTLAFALIDLGVKYEFQVEGKTTGERKIISYPPLIDILTFSDWKALPKGRMAFPFGFFSFWLLVELDKISADKSTGILTKKLKDASFEDQLDELIKSKAELIPETEQEIVKKGVMILRRMTSLAPVCTIFGGLIGQEVLKVVSGQGEPIQNILFFDAKTTGAIVRLVPPNKA